MRNTKDNQKIVPTITIKIHNQNGVTQLRPTSRKMRNLLRTRLKDLCKKGTLVTMRVIYGKAESITGKIETFDNEVTTDNLETLEWAFEAFLDKDLWIISNKGGD